MSRKNQRGRGSLCRKTRRGKEYGAWIAKFWVDGKRIQVNTHTTDYDEAERIYRQHLEKVKVGQLSADRSSISIVDFAAHFMEHRRKLVTRGKIKESTFTKYEDAINNFLRFVKETKPTLKVADVTTTLVERYMDYRLGQTRQNKGNVPITKSGVNKDVTFLSTVFKQAVKEGVIVVNPINEDLNWFDVKRTKTREHTAEEIFTDEEVKLILAEVKEHYSDAYPVIAAIAMTGARRAEMAHLRRENVDFERNLIHIEPDPETGWSPKNEASIRAVPMCPELRRIMEELLQRPDLPRHNYAFSDPDGNPLWQWEDFPLRRLQSAIRRLRNKKKVQVRLGTLRMLRHWFISYGLNRKENPINPAEMIRLVGHTDMSMICRVYYHADLKKVSDKMESFKIVSEEPAPYEVIPLGA